MTTQRIVVERYQRQVVQTYAVDSIAVVWRDRWRVVLVKGRWPRRQKTVLEDNFKTEQEAALAVELHHLREAERA